MANGTVRRVRFWGMALSAMVALAGCDSSPTPTNSLGLNSRYNDEQPALSGDGRWLAFVSNRNGSNQIAVYDLRQRRFVDLPGLNQSSAIAQNPSLSLTGRYITYIINDRGRPEISLYDRETQQSEILSQRYSSWVRNPKISPDGRYVVFETARRGQWDVEVLDRGPNIELDVPDGSPVQ
ncbi:TolB family protein [Lusitaniella coriacea LEGE 07157]|uniref:TolB family protein n=2 Tax=Lusitaniella TaxID=1983104 RepID=A0A8J7B822_9CYAN|nr:PD40 domain-containing protein [Lusitaniella coriacea]MBE9114955.1 TolB family protein [Lusitaniella coriacea LEGE 07157]